MVFSVNLLAETNGYVNILLPSPVVMKTNINSLTALTPIDTEDSPYHYTFTVTCTSCREAHPNPISLTRFEEHKTMSRGTANFVLKCRSCGRQSSISILEPPKSYIVQDPPTSQPIVKFETRGCSVENVVVAEGNTWTAESEKSKWEVDLSEVGSDGWVEYDEKAGEEVGIETLKWEIGRG